MIDRFVPHSRLEDRSRLKQSFVRGVNRSLAVFLMCFCTMIFQNCSQSAAVDQNSTKPFDFDRTPSLKVQSSQNSCFPWAGQTPLQDAINQYECVEIQSGSYGLSSQLLVPPGHTLKGKGLSTALRALPSWQIHQADALIVAWPPQSPGALVSDLVVDGGNITTYAIGYSYLTADRLTIQNARCAGVGISGPQLVVKNSKLVNNGWPAVVPGRGLLKCSDSLGGVELGAGIYGEARGGAYWAPQILNNVISHNYGPALDNNGVWGGTFQGNSVFDNRGWAGVSLYGASFWTVADNKVSHPSDETVGEMAIYHPTCARGPAGARSAALFLCQDTIEDGLLTNFNSIVNNQASGFYGILSVGNATQAIPFNVPRLNHFSSNNVIGSRFGCADDFQAGDWYGDENTWSGMNTCQGTPNTGPRFF